MPETRQGCAAGSDAEVTLAAYPGLRSRGGLSLYYQTGSGQSHLACAYRVAQPRGQLRAGMSAQVRLVPPARHALAVPTEAIIRTGQRALVIAVREGRFFRGHQLGPEIDNHTVIVAGLAEGQSIVSSAQFLLDSEASLPGCLHQQPPPRIRPPRIPR